METPENFDEKIRAKMENFEAEPSAKVWRGVRAEVNGKNRKGGFYFVTMSIAATILLLVVSYLVIKGFDKEKETFAGGSTPSAPLRDRLTNPNKNNSTPIIDSLTKDEKEMIQSNPNLNPTFGQNQKPALQKTNDVVKTNDIKKDIIPQKDVQFTDRNQNNNVHVPNENHPIQKEDIKIKQEQKNEIIQLNTNDAPIAQVNKNENKNDNSKGEANGIAAVLAKGARDYLGMDVDYREKQNEGSKTYAFNADFKLFKIERVRTIKN